MPYIHTYIHTYVHTYIHTYIYIYKYIYNSLAFQKIDLNQTKKERLYIRKIERMAWDQAKMNKNEPNYEQLNFKLEILERERERGLTCLALAQNTKNHMKDY